MRSRVGGWLGIHVAKVGYPGRSGGRCWWRGLGTDGYPRLVVGGVNGLVAGVVELRLIKPPLGSVVCRLCA